MKRKAGVWINHSKAVIFILADEGAQVLRISSGLNEDTQPHEGSEPDPGTNHDNAEAPAPLIKYFDEVLSSVRDAESILIFGPGEAKIEQRKRLEKVKLQGRIVGFESVDAMTDDQIVSKIRDRFLK